MPFCPGKKALLLHAAFSAAVSSAALIYVFTRMDVSALWEALGRLRGSGLGLALFVPAAALPLLALPWHLLLRRENCSAHFAGTMRISVARSLDNFVFGGFFGACIGAERYAKAFERDRKHIAKSVFLDRFLGLDALFTLSVIAAIVSWISGGFENLRLAGRSELVCLLLLLMLGWAAGVVLWLERSPAGREWFQTLGEFFSEASELVGVAWRILLPWCFGLMATALRIALFPVLLWAVSGGELPWLRMAWVFPLLYLAGALPVSVHGLGVRELAAMLFLSGYGVSGEQVVAAALVAFLIGAAGAGGAAWLLAQERRTVRESSPRPVPESVSVVIPTRNEAISLPETLRHLRQFPEIRELIVVDGGSLDRTREIAAEHGARVFTAPPGRGGQMRMGAMHAQGDVLLLLHAETLLPENGIEALLNCLRDRTVAGGGFFKTFRERKLLLAGSRVRCALRLYLGGMVFGDQAIFIRREILEKMGGVPDLPLMEEFELCRRLR